MLEDSILSFLSLVFLAKPSSTVISSKKEVFGTGHFVKEIKELTNFLKRNKCKNFALLKCTSAYPSMPLDSNVKTINDMRNKFKCEIGLSDHTLGIGASIAAISNGATIIEKHITLNKKANGVDVKFSLEPYPNWINPRPNWSYSDTKRRGAGIARSLKGTAILVALSWLGTS